MSRKLIGSILGIAVIVLAVVFYLNSTTAPDFEKTIQDSPHVLSPKDFGIQKMVFRAHPKRGEVAVFTSTVKFAGDLVREDVDYYHTDGEICAQSILVIDRHQFALQGAEKKGEPPFCPDIRVQAGHFHFEFDHLYFSSGSASQSKSEIRLGNRVTFSGEDFWQMNYNENWDGDGRVLTIEFKLKTMKYEEALKMYPKLPLIERNNSWSSRESKNGPGFSPFYDSVKKSANP